MFIHSVYEILTKNERFCWIKNEMNAQIICGLNTVIEWQVNISNFD